MGIYKNVYPVYGKNEKNERVYTGLSVDGVFYKGIRKTGEIPSVTKPKSVKQTTQTVQPKKRSIFSKPTRA